MNEYHKRLLGAPDLDTQGCAICGRWSPTNLHHIIPRSQGGGDVSPLVRLCGIGNTLYDDSGRLFHHGMAHQMRLHFRYEDDRWEYLITEEPTKYERALEMPGWMPLQSTYMRTMPGGEFGEVPF